METIVYLIYDMGAKLTASNVSVINQTTELNFEDLENVTYQNLIDARELSRGSEYGYPKYKDGVLVYVLPCIPMGLVVDPLSIAIKEVTKEVYKSDYLATFDVIDEAII